MSVWLIVPRDPLIFRDGKPFAAIPGERSKSLGFPFPATIAGALRTRLGPDAATGEFNEKRIEELKKFSIRGPLLVELTEQGDIAEWYFPAPADALLVDLKKCKKISSLDKNKAPQILRQALVPLKLPEGALSDLKSWALVG